MSLGLIKNWSMLVKILPTFMYEPQNEKAPIKMTWTDVEGY